MGEVIVDFRGICTHFRRTPDTPVAQLPVAHRVVVVDATHLPPDLRQRGIHPHKPFLFFSSDGEDPNGKKEPLANGVTVTIQGAAGEVSYDENYKRLPSLVLFQKDYVPCMNVVDRYAAACYIDIQGGALSTVIRGDEISVRWTVTLPDGVPPVVLLTQENGDIDERPVPEGMTVVVDQSTDPAAGHGHNDFVLHYLTSEVGIPGVNTGASMPGQPSGSVRPPHYWQEAMTAACSNSGYP